MSLYLIIISGFSCRGKTVLAKKVGKRFLLLAIGRVDTTNFEDIDREAIFNII